MYEYGCNRLPRNQRLEVASDSVGLHDGYGLLCSAYCLSGVEVGERGESKKYQVSGSKYQIAGIG